MLIKNSNHPFLALIEIFVSICLYYIVTWKISYYLLEPKLWEIFFVFLLVLLTAYYILFKSPKIYKESYTQRGMNIFSNFLSSSPNYIFVFILFFIILNIMTYFKFNSYELEINYFSVFLKFIFYLLSATIQDIVFFSFLLLRIQYFLHSFSLNYERYLVAIFFSILFSLSHYPNTKLCIITFFFSFILGFVFIKKRNILWVVLIHSFAGTYLHRIYQMDMKVAIFYGTDESYFRKIFPQIDSLIGNLW